MPLSRKKSCLACISSKLRCDRNLPTCSRCAKKNMRCMYDTQRPAPYPDVSSLGPPAASLGRSVQTRLAGLRNVRHESRDLAHAGSADQNGLFSQSDLTNPDPLSDMDSRLETGDKIAPLLAMESNNPPDYSNFLDPWVFEADPDPQVALATIDNSTTSVVASTTDESTLARRPFAQGTVLSSVILGQLTSYPKMMIEGEKLPPFISSPCHHHKESMAPECGEKGSHQCLPPDLAICQSLVRSFYSRTPANEDFVWRSVYAEHERIKKEYPHYDRNRRLDALQSLVILLLMQAEDADTIEKNSATLLLETVTETTVNIARSGAEWRFEVPLGVPDRDEWLFLESLRRAIAVLHVVAILLQGIIIPPCQVIDIDHRFVSHPVPCHRDLWEARTTRDWRIAFRKYLSTRKSSRLLMVSDILSADEAILDASVKEDVVRWCENMDQLGTLFWMVLPLERWRSAIEAIEGG